MAASQSLDNVASDSCTTCCPTPRVHAVKCNENPEYLTHREKHTPPKVIELNKPDYQTFGDTFDEVTGRMEVRGKEAEERKELTGTSFQYQRVGHCQIGRDRKYRKAKEWKTGAQGELLSLKWKNYTHTHEKGLNDSTFLR